MVLTWPMMPSSGATWAGRRLQRLGAEEAASSESCLSRPTCEMASPAFDRSNPEVIRASFDSHGCALQHNPR